MTTEPREIIFGETARAKLRDGIETLADVVSVTLGPAGCNVAYESWKPTITRDGNSIVGEIDLKDQFKNMGVSLGKEAVAKVRERCGDGSTTTVVLLRALVSNGVKMIAAGASPIGLKRGIDRAIEGITQQLRSMAQQISGSAEILNIAQVSAAGDRAIGEMIAQAYDRVGKEGVITIEEAKGLDTTVEVVEGLRFDRGYASPYFCSNMESMVAEIATPALLLVDGEIAAVQEMLPILQAVAASGRELLIIADDFKGEVIPTLVVNKLRGSLKVTAVKAPGFGDQRKAILQDLAVLTGATVISEAAGITLKQADPSVLGQCDRATITKDKTTLVGGQGDTAAIEARIHQLQKEESLATNQYDKDKLKERVAKLRGGVAVIRVGAATEPELKMRKQVFQDSLNSTWAALSEGVVPGGGIALLRAAQAMLAESSASDDEALGAKLVYQACLSPLKQLALNSCQDPHVVVAKVLKADKNYGFNVLTENVEDLVQAGVIDALLVVLSALHVAGSVAGVVLLSESLIGDVEEEEGR